METMTAPNYNKPQRPTTDEVTIEAAGLNQDILAANVREEMQQSLDTVESEDLDVDTESMEWILENGDKVAAELEAEWQFKAENVIRDLVVTVRNQESYDDELVGGRHDEPWYVEVENTLAGDWITREDAPEELTDVTVRSWTVSDGLQDALIDCVNAEFNPSRPALTQDWDEYATYVSTAGDTDE